MSIRNDLIQAVRRWGKTCLGLTDGQIVPVMRGSTDKFMRRRLPYLTVSLPSLELENGVDVTYHKADGSKVLVGNRQATVRIMGYGEEAEDWLRELTMRLDEYEEDYGTLVNILGPVQDVSIPVDEHIEHQYVKDLRLEYRIKLTLTDDDNTTAYATAFVVDTESADGIVQQHLQVDT